MSKEIELANGCPNCIHYKTEEYDPAPASVPGSSTKVDMWCREGHDKYFRQEQKCPHFKQIPLKYCEKHDEKFVDECPGHVKERRQYTNAQWKHRQQVMKEIGNIIEDNNGDTPSLKDLTEQCEATDSEALVRSALDEYQAHQRSAQKYEEEQEQRNH